MKLIEDLGTRGVGSKGRCARFGLYECPICKKHFETCTGDVKSGKSTKCSSCAKKITSLARAARAASEFIVKARATHGDLYDYLSADYVSTHTKVKITCQIHGVFEQTPANHLRGQGCPTCAAEANYAALAAAARTKASNAAMEFLDKALYIHGDLYDYTSFNYVNANTKSEFCCRIHGIFLQTPGHHLEGHGCPQCAKTGFNYGKKAILYYLKVSHDDVVAYKIGVTNRTVRDRFTADDLRKINVIATWDYAVGIEAYNKEQEIIMDYKEYRYQGKPVLSSGNTELFILDVLELDKG